MRLFLELLFRLLEVFFDQTPDQLRHFLFYEDAMQFQALVKIVG